MIRIHRWAALALVALVTVGCASTQAGTGIAAPGGATAPASGPAADAPAPQITVPSTSSPGVTPSSSGRTPSSSDAAPTPLAGASVGIAGFSLCPDAVASDESAVVQCLGESLSSFWSTRLGLSVSHQVVVDPDADQVPAACRSALTTAPAFTCQVDNVVYLDPKLTALVDGHFAEADRPYALAVVLAHEFGHVVQADVKQSGYGDSSPAGSKRIEQQADCLSGVWAHQQSSVGDLDASRFVADAHTLITAISDKAEMAGHGTPQERAAALANGLQNGRQQDCALTDTIGSVPAA